MLLILLCFAVCIALCRRCMRPDHVPKPDDTVAFLAQFKDRIEERQALEAGITLEDLRATKCKFPGAKVGRWTEEDEREHERYIRNKPKPRPKPVVVLETVWPRCCICDPRIPLNPYLCAVHKQAARDLAGRKGLLCSSAAGDLYLEALNNGS